jgi:prepilin-type N-terminal cleavage/methylation domain-containing protein
MTRSARRGFSLIEVAISSLVLGVAIAGLTSTYTSSEKGMQDSKARTSANELALQRLELLATQPVDQLPGCAGPAVCQNGFAFTAPAAAAGTYQCTQYVDEADVVDPSQAGSDNNRFRVDTAVEDHPDALRQPGARVVTVSVCWADRSGRVSQVTARRSLVPGV